MEYAVIDLETTGLSPGHHHRVVELAVVRLDDRGKMIRDYCTLVNPQRDLGPTHIHGIMAADVSQAPMFDEVAGDVINYLRDAVLVAHNVQFELAFLRSEFQRCGMVFPDTAYLCTMQFARKAMPKLRGRSLPSLCDQLNIPCSNAHEARNDAVAAATLFKHCLSANEDVDPRHFIRGGSPNCSWPHRRPGGKSVTRSHVREQSAKPSTFMNHLIAKFPCANGNTVVLDEYLALLDQALLDRVITPSESDDLLALASDLGFGREDIMNAHRRYVRDLVFYALEDGVITERERRDLETVARILGVKEQEMEAMVENIEAGDLPEELITREAEFEGKSVCFSGALVCSINGERLNRAKAQSLALEAGMITAKSVTKELDYLVLADPGSMSSKARKARRYGIPILAETAFWLMLGIEVN